MKLFLDILCGHFTKRHETLDSRMYVSVVMNSHFMFSKPKSSKSCNGQSCSKSSIQQKYSNYITIALCTVVYHRTVLNSIVLLFITFLTHQPFLEKLIRKSIPAQIIGYHFMNPCNLSHQRDLRSGELQLFTYGRPIVYLLLIYRRLAHILKQKLTHFS